MTKKLLIVLATIVLVGVGLFLRVKQVARRNLAGEAPESSEAPVRATRAATPLQVSEVAYDGKLGAGWQDWGWGPHILSEAGPAKINFSGFGGLMLHHNELRPSFGGIAFRYKAAEDWPLFFALRLRRAGGTFPLVQIEPRHVAKLPGGWLEVLVDWRELNPNNAPVDGVSIAASLSVASDWVLLDQVVFTKPTGLGAGSNAPVRDVQLRIDCNSPSKPIDPMIYGAAVGDWESGISAQRLGGNPMTRQNWDAPFYNAGNDWFFENSKGGVVSDLVQVGADHHAPTALVVPMIGWVAKDATSVSFPRSKFPKQRKFDPHRADVGDGYSPDGKPIKPGPPSETSVAATPATIGRWVRALTEKDRAQGTRRVAMYILDNEPALWSSTHRDVHPDPLSYDELLDRTIRYATEIREADPDGLIAGPAEWGWNGYNFSAKDLAGGSAEGADRRAHGDLPLVAWYLRKLAEHEKKTGKRLLDVLDLHFYPAAEGVFGEHVQVDVEASALRLRSTRALWDPTYRDESWIKETIRLIPRMKSWIADNYPGRKTSIGEWSFGADDHISGALATAEALGRFGQQGLDAAFYWGGPRPGTGTFWAFRAFRNFDGKGGRFLDFSLSTRDAQEVSLFGSVDKARTHIVAVMVNRDASFGVNADLQLEGCGRVVSRRVFNYGPTSKTLEEARPTAKAAVASALRVEPFSIAVIDMQVASP
ncbi:MAG: glycoside hydrolase family 44 protein [Pseudomonadota bacterium]